MCIEVKTNVVIVLSLKNRRCVCGKRLLKKRAELLKTNKGFMADVSFASVRQFVEIHSSALSIRFRHGTYGVCRKKEKNPDKMFNDDFQKRYCEAVFSSEEIEFLKRILSSR